MRDKNALTTGDVAKYCGVNFRTVIRWIERGHLDAYKLPGRGDNRIPVDSFVDFLANNNMPIPEELEGNSQKMVILTGSEDFSTEVAASVRRAGWDLLVTKDPVYFGYLITHHHPTAVAVTCPEVRESVLRILKECDMKETICMSIGSSSASPHGGQDGWLNLRWPEDQQQFVLHLTSNQTGQPI